MLAALGFASRAALIDAIVPAGIRRRAPLALPRADERGCGARAA